MSKDYRVYLEDILEAAGKIRKYSEGMDFEAFAGNSLVSDAVIRNLLIIGEAAKCVPAEIKKQHQDIKWKKISGLRDILVHEYSAVDMAIVWDVVTNKLPALETAVRTILGKYDR